MSRRILCSLTAVLLFVEAFVAMPAAKAANGTFTDTRFQGEYTTENLDAIIEEYELYDGWYWSTQLNVYQTFHGQEGKKAWTQSSSERFDPFIYTWGWFGCRWNWDIVTPSPPNKDGWGECFGFAQFLGYLLSGDRNPHGHWAPFTSLGQARGLKVGDIIRIEYTDENGTHQHSAMVYSLEGDKVLFLQASGSNYNRMYIRQGFCGADLNGSTSVSEICSCKGLKILRAEENLDGVYPPDWKH